MEKWKRFVDDCEILQLKTGLIKPDYLLTILTSVKNDIQFSMELNHNELHFLDILIKRSGKKNLGENLFKTIDSKRYVSYLSIHPKTLS